METIIVKNFDDVDDPVKTEHILFEQLTKLSGKVKTDFAYVAMPIADLINKTGIANTQSRIADVCESNKDKKLFFVCQHIQVDKLNFYGHLVFTPHSTIFDSYVPIPHYACNYDSVYSKPWNEREYDFSFMGDYGTHRTRSLMYEALKNRPKTIFVDTKKWHFHSDSKTQKINKQNYIELLGNTKYSLCPRGTGPSTIRIWEAMAMNSCPIILSNYLKMPLELFLKTSLWYKSLEDCSSFDVDFEIYNNQEYWNLFSNENLYKSVIKNL